jgi:hypothetical protein
MIRVREIRQRMLAQTLHSSGTVNGPRRLQGHKTQLLTAKADGGPVILGNGGEIRSTRGLPRTPLGSAVRQGHDEAAFAFAPSGRVRNVRITLI